MSMCCSLSSIHSWFHEPIVPSKEVCRLAIFTAIALFAIGFATYCYFYGTTPGHNEIYAYCLWGMTGGAVLCTLISYVARAILSRKFVRQDQAEPKQIRKPTRAQQEYEKKYNDIFNMLFPNLELAKLPIFNTNLLGATGYFNKDTALIPFFQDNTNIIRGQQDNRPFIGIHLAIHGNDNSKTSAILLIAPNPNRSWYVHASLSITHHIYPNLHEDTPECLLFIDWIKSILQGETRFLLQQDENWGDQNPEQSYLIEKKDGPRVSLWQD